MSRFFSFRPIFWAVLTVLSVCLLLLLCRVGGAKNDEPLARQPREIDPKNIERGISKVEIIMNVTLVALDQYRDEFKEIPGKDNKTITGALLGKNPKKMIFLNLKPSETNENGEIIDTWKTPYQFVMTDDGNGAFEIKSAGPDCIFGTSDDKRKIGKKREKDTEAKPDAKDHGNTSTKTNKP